MKIRAVVLEFFARRQTDRHGGGLCFIICIDILYRNGAHDGQGRKLSKSSFIEQNISKIKTPH